MQSELIAAHLLMALRWAIGLGICAYLVYLLVWMLDRFIGEIQDRHLRRYELIEWDGD